MSAKLSRNHIEARLKEMGHDWKWLADQLGASKGVLGNWKARGVAAKHHAAVALALNKSVDWVATGGASNVVTLQKPDSWPFALVDRHKYEALSVEARGAVQMKMIEEIDRWLQRGIGNG